MDPNETTGPEDENAQQAKVDLIGAVWAAMDAGLDEAQVRDNIDQAISTWEPQDGDAGNAPEDGEHQSVHLAD